MKKIFAPIVNGLIKIILRVICKIDASELKKVPTQGPMILVVNHVNFLDVPLIVSHMGKRPMTALVKTETWDSPIFSALFTLWGAIPIKRGTADFGAYNQALEALAAGKILAISPEGTRSGDGRLIEAQTGIIALAQKSHAPILPMAYYGGEDFWKNFKKLKRTPFKIVVGEPFFLDLNGTAPSKEVRRKATDEIMYQIARLLPDQYWGHYADMDALSTSFIRFTPLNQTGG